jgi:RimJ/RimL family protein N-acetyltransferase
MGKGLQIDLRELVIMEPTPLELVAVKSTLPALPYPPFDSRPVIRTERLVMRAFSAIDLDGLHTLRTQPEVMQWTSTGRVDPDLTKTREVLDNALGAQGERTYNCVLCLASTGELIGAGGMHVREGNLGWPEIGYMLRKEFWGQGLATEFIKGFMAAWWALPRAEYEVKVDRTTLPEDVKEGDAVPEQVVALTVEYNGASRNVLEKAGMELTKIWDTEDSQDTTRNISLYCYTVRA